MFKKILFPSDIKWMAIFAWLLYVLFYITLKHVLNFYTVSACILLIGEVGLDLVALILIIRLWRKSKNKIYRNIFLYFYISFLFSTIADCIYNVILNLLNSQHISSLAASFFDLPFILFLFFQLISWWLIFCSNKDLILKSSTFIPYVLLSFFIFCMFMFGIPWQLEYFSLIGLFQAIDTFLEVIGFALVTICLVRAKTVMIRLIGIGYLIIVSSDLVIRYFVVSGTIPYLSPLEITWVFGLLLICLGFASFCQDNENEAFKLLPANSLQSQFALWSFILWLMASLLYISLYYIFLKNSSDSNITMRNYLSMLIPFSVLIIISSNYLSNKIAFSLCKLEENINSFTRTEKKDLLFFNVKNNLDQKSSENELESSSSYFGLHEVEKLNVFIINTLAELKEANQVKSNFLMNMSHDFRTPASGIYHMSRILYKKIKDQELKRLQKLIVNSAEQLMKYIEDILDFSRLENNGFKIDLSSIDIIEVINDVVVFLSAKAKEKKLTIKISYHESPIYYISDRSIIYRILLNLISNAIKFTDKGEIIVSAKKENKDSANWVIISIKDTGIGIDERHHELIFEPFSCVKSEQARGHDGIGLGLSNVLLMLNKMGGKIILESKLNEGSNFTVFLPVSN